MSTVNKNTVDTRWSSAAARMWTRTLQLYKILQYKMAVIAYVLGKVVFWDSTGSVYIDYRLCSWLGGKFVC